MNKNIKLVLVIGAITMLPACAPLEWVKHKLGFAHKDSAANQVATAGAQELSGQVLATMAGKTLVTAESLDREFDQFLVDNPQLRQLVQFMPNAKYNFMVGKVSQEVVNKYVHDHKIHEKKDYQDKLKHMLASLEGILNTEFFNMEHPARITDTEVVKFYEDNKATMPELLLSRGGVEASGVAFSKEEDAKAFAAKAKGQDLAKVAKASGSKVHDFKLVNAQSVGIDNAVKNKISALTKLPALEVVKGDDKSFWVVSATKKQEPKYRPFDDQVKNGLKQYLEKEKQVAIMNQEITKLNKEYQVVINEEYFKNQEAPQQATAEKDAAHPTQELPAASKTA